MYQLDIGAAALTEGRVVYKVCVDQRSFCFGLLTRERFSTVSWSADRYALIMIRYLTRKLPFTVAAECPYQRDLQRNSADLQLRPQLIGLPSYEP